VAKEACDEDCASECSVELDSALTEAEKRKKDHCAKKKYAACPF
jgi:hypothetical protein